MQEIVLALEDLSIRSYTKIGFSDSLDIVFFSFLGFDNLVSGWAES